MMQTDDWQGAYIVCIVSISNVRIIIYATKLNVSVILLSELILSCTCKEIFKGGGKKRGLEEKHNNGFLTRQLTVAS